MSLGIQKVPQLTRDKRVWICIEYARAQRYIQAQRYTFPDEYKLILVHPFVHKCFILARIKINNK